MNITDLILELMEDSNVSKFKVSVSLDYVRVKQTMVDQSRVFRSFKVGMDKEITPFAPQWKDRSQRNQWVELLTEAEFKQKEIALLLGISQALVSKIVNGMVLGLIVE